MPTPPDPIVLRILNDVQSALDAVATPAYPVTIVTQQPTQPKPGQQDGLCTIELGDPTREPLEDTPAGWIGWRQPVLCSVSVLVPEDNPVPFSQMFAWYIASMEKALLLDVNRGGLAEDTVPDGTVIYWAAEGLCYVQSRFVVEYRTKYGDPWSQ